MTEPNEGVIESVVEPVAHDAGVSPSDSEPTPPGGVGAEPGGDKIDEGIPPEFAKAGVTTKREFDLAMKFLHHGAAIQKQVHEKEAKATQDVKAAPEDVTPTKVDPLDAYLGALRTKVKAKEITSEQAFDLAVQGVRQQTRAEMMEYLDSELETRLAGVNNTVLENTKAGFFAKNPQFSPAEKEIRKIMDVIPDDSGVTIMDFIAAVDKLKGTKHGLPDISEADLRQERLRRARMGTEGFVETPNQTRTRTADRQEINKEKAAILADLRKGNTEGFRAGLAKWNAARS